MVNDERATLGLTACTVIAIFCPTRYRWAAANPQGAERGAMLSASWLPFISSISASYNNDPQATPTIIALADTHALPAQINPFPSSMSPIGYWSDLQYDNTAIAHVFYSTPMTSPQLLSSIAHDPITRPALYLIAVDLKCPSSACNALDKALETLKEIHGQTESCESALDAIIVACNADSFLDDVRDYMADVMAGALRRRALSIGAGLIYCKNGQDFQTVRFHIAKHIGSFTASGAERSDGDVRDVTLSDPFLVIPIRTDTIDLIDKLTPSEYQFTDLFPEIEEDPPAQENRITAIDDDEFLEMLKNDISKSSCPDTPSHIKPSVNNRIIGSPSLSLNTPTTPSTKSQNAVKSFFESLLSPRSKDDHNQHRTRQRQAKDALLDINSNINRRA